MILMYCKVFNDSLVWFWLCNEKQKLYRLWAALSLYKFETFILMTKTLLPFCYTKYLYKLLKLIVVNRRQAPLAHMCRLSFKAQCLEFPLLGNVSTTRSCSIYATFFRLFYCWLDRKIFSRSTLPKDTFDYLSVMPSLKIERSLFSLKKLLLSRARIIFSSNYK